MKIEAIWQAAKNGNFCRVWCRGGGCRNVVVDKTDPVFSLYSPIIGCFTPESPSWIGLYIIITRIRYWWNRCFYYILDAGLFNSHSGQQCVIYWFFSPAAKIYSPITYLEQITKSNISSQRDTKWDNICGHSAFILFKMVFYIDCISFWNTGDVNEGQNEKV